MIVFIGKSTFMTLVFAAMRSFVTSCEKLLNEEVIRKLMVPLESAMAMMIR